MANILKPLSTIAKNSINDLTNYTKMSKKSGLFYLMLTWMFGLFSEGYKIHSPSHFQPSGSTNRFSGGQEITSYGKKPVYKPLHPEQKKAKQEKR